MKQASSLDVSEVEANESLTILDDTTARQFRIYNRGPGAVTVFDRGNNEVGRLVAGNCLDFVGDHFTIRADGPEGAKVLYEPVNLALRNRHWE